MKEQYLRTEMLLGEGSVERLRRCHVAVFGLGGVGSYAAEALCRAGIGTLTLIDSDTVSLSNINRKLYALHSTVGQPKAVVAAARCRDIDSDVAVRPLVGTYCAENRQDFWEDYDYVVDAIDLVSCKLDLIEQAQQRHVPIISALGTGNKLRSDLLTVTDISKTSGDALARVVRKELRTRGILHTKVVFSPEEPMEPLPLETPPPGRRSVPASVSWVPSAAGLLMAGEVIRDLLK